MPGLGSATGEATEATEAETPAHDPLQAALKVEAESAGGAVLEFYQDRGFSSAWEVMVRRDALNQATWDTGSEGISRTQMDIRSFRDRLKSHPGNDPAAVAARDVATTRFALRYIGWMRHGIVNPVDLHPKWQAIALDQDDVGFLAAALAKPPGEFATELAKAIRNDPTTEALRTALRRYEAIEAEGGWQRIAEPEEAVEPGAPYAEVAQLRARLQVEGDLAADAVPARVERDPESREAIYDEETAEGLRAFQIRHGIEPDGILGPETVGELNIPVTARVRALIVNLERLRWMPLAMPERCVVVNIPRSKLTAYSGGAVATTMRVIVGEKEDGRHTPVFHSDIEYLIFRPYWNIPVGIAREEIVPNQRVDPGYFSRNNYEIVPGYGSGSRAALPATGGNLSAAAAGSLFVRQRPGDGNALGLIKFIFPNDSAVYLHDTSARSLFQRTDRDFSHGCVRVEHPEELGAWALEDNGIWPAVAVRQKMNDETVHSEQVNLKHPLPVYLVYWTASVGTDGLVYFDQDIYDHDFKTAQAMGM